LRIGVASISLLICLLATRAGAQDTTPAAGPPPASAAQAGLSSQDKDFLIGAAKNVMLQIELARIAEVHAKNPQLRQSARRVVQSFSKSKGRLWTIAQEFSVTLPPNPPDDAAKMGRELSGKTPTELDRQYVDDVVPANSLAVNLFNSEAHGGKNPVLVQFAREMLPRLQERQRSLLQFGRQMGEPRGPRYTQR
jgi:putative membrane protein